MTEQEEIDLLTRFWSKVTNPGNWDTSKCFVWNAGCEKDGYGIFWFNKKSLRAHRFIYNHYNGPISDDIFVLHECNNPPCVNLEHLYEGTAKDNSDYMLSCGRESKLVISPTLTHDDILKILQGIDSGEFTSVTEIERNFPIARKSVINLLKGKTWREFTSQYYDDTQFAALYDKIARRYLTIPVIKDIKQRLKNGEATSSIAIRYGVHVSFVSKIKLGKNYQNV